jgi:ribose-phosphate pyrophosphokinase
MAKLRTWQMQQEYFRKKRHHLSASDVRFFSGRSHPQLAQGIAEYLGIPLAPTTIESFSNDNLYIQLGASVRERTVYLVQSLIPPVSEHLMELLMMLDIAQSAGASQVHAVIPYFSYARSDKKDAPRISITARLIADLLQTAGATHLMTMTMHSPQVHGFFSIPTDPLTARHLFVRHFKEKKYSSGDTIVVAPDVGRAKPAARFADQLGLRMGAAQKTRQGDDQVSIEHTIERQIEGCRQAIIYDDEIATGATVIALCDRLVASGIQAIDVVCTHGLFTRDSLQRLSAMPSIAEIVTTDTVPIPGEKRTEKLKIIPVASVFGEAIWRNATRQSIGGLFGFSEDGESAQVLPNN